MEYEVTIEKSLAEWVAKNGPVSARIDTNISATVLARGGKVYVRIDVDDAWADAVRSSVQGWVAGWASQG
jgi:predicted Zn-dependent protease